MARINWESKVALVTGASSGIGESTARLLAQKGLCVILTARRTEKLEHIQNEIIASGGRSLFFPADLSIEADRLDLYHYLESLGQLPDVLVNNAGIAWYGYFHQMPWNIARDIIQLNMEATIHLSLLFLPHMLSKKFGRVINIGSIAGKLPEQGIAVYSGSKAFLDAITKSINRDMRGTGVHISVIRSGPVKTEFFDIARSQENGSSVPAEKLAVNPKLVSRKVWNVLQCPRRYAYVPGWMILSPLLEFFFSGIIDLLGPLLLKKNHN